MTAFNIRSGNQLADSIEVADNLFKRMKGLLGKKQMRAGEALWIKPCMSIHTFLMRFPIDVIFLDRRNQVIETVRNLQPNRITKLHLKSASVLELSVGVLEASDTRVGDAIEIR